MLTLLISLALGSIRSCGNPTHPHVRFNQDDIKHLTNVTSYQVCCAQCFKTEGCRAYTFQISGNCYLKSGTHGVFSDYGSTSSWIGPGPAPPLPPPGPTPPTPPAPPSPSPSPTPMPPVPPSQRTWMNKSDTAEVRAAKLVGFMNVTEMVTLMHGKHSEDKDYGWYVGRIDGIERLGIPALQMNDGPQGFRDMNNSHNGMSTQFPSGLTVAATFDPNMAAAWGSAMGEEFAGKGANVQLGPGLCIARIPLNGRNFEYMSGEDPFLGYTLVKPAVAGIQSKGVIANAKHWVNNNQETNRTTDISFIDERANFEIYYPPFEGAIEANVGSVMCSYNRINYGEVGSQSKWSCENPESLKRDLKGRLGFKGWVMSDWGATHSASINEGLDQEMPAGQFMNNGRDDQGAQDCQPTQPGQPNHLCPQIADGTVSMATLKESAMRVLTPMFQVGIFDNPNNNTTQNNVSNAQTVAVARRVAAAAMVLLQNTDNLLPLSVAEISSIAVIGTQAASPVAGGGGSGSVSAPALVAPLDAIRRMLGIAGNATQACTGPPVPPPNPANCPAPQYNSTDFNGHDIVEPPLKLQNFGECCAECTKRAPLCVAYTYSSPKGPGNCYLKSSMEGRAPGGGVSGTPALPPPPPRGAKCVTYDDGGDVNRAAAVAAAANVTIVFVMTNSGEGTDRSSLDINNGWNGKANENVTALVEAVANVSKKVIVVIVSPGAVLTPWRSKVSGVIAAFMPGLQYGNAISDVLFGARPPTGRLPLTFPATENDMQITQRQWPGLAAPNPTTGIVGLHGKSYYSEKLEVGYRYYDAHNVEPAYPFGHGLTYTTFEYSNLKVSTTSVTLTVSNTGSRDGTEVVQLYMSFPAAAGEPPKQLKGFQQVPVTAGASVQVTLTLNERTFSIWDAITHAWMVPKGTFTAMVGSSSRDIRLTGTIQQ